MEGRMSSQEPPTKERIKQCLNTLERFYDPDTGKIDGPKMMEHINELEAENEALREENERLKEENEGLATACDNLYLDVFALQEQGE
jgi:predicted nuclease with TOPRIM domain